MRVKHTMKLTPAQKAALFTMLEHEDHCGRLNPKTAWSLNYTHKLVEPTSGYGYRFGEIYQLTTKGVNEAIRLKNAVDSKRLEELSKC